MTKKKPSVDLFSELENYQKSIDEKFKIIPTGITSLDVSLGVGGIPCGRFVEIYGAEGTGKTTLALTIANAFLKSDPRNVLYCDAEQALSNALLDNILDSEVRDRFYIVQPGTLEEALLICENALQSEECSLIILDSIGSLAPQVVFDKELIDKTVGILASVFTVFLQRNAVKVRKSQCTFLGINQVRDAVGSYIKTFSTPGGHAWKHITSIRIDLSYPSAIKHKENKIGINTNFVIRKNKLAPPFRGFQIPIIFGKGVDKIRDLVAFAEMLGVLQKKGSYYVFEDVNLGLGVENTLEFLANNPETLDRIKHICYNLINSDSIPEVEDLLLDDE